MASMGGKNSLHGGTVDDWWSPLEVRGAITAIGGAALTASHTTNATTEDASYYNPIIYINNFIAPHSGSFSYLFRRAGSVADGLLCQDLQETVRQFS